VEIRGVFDFVSSSSHRFVMFLWKLNGLVGPLLETHRSGQFSKPDNQDHTGGPSSLVDLTEGQADSGT